MKVRIVKCENNALWYKEQVGGIFNVKSESDVHFFANGLGAIIKQDCEIIEADEPKPEPFDLERALKGEKVITLDGRNVSECCHIKTLKADANILIVCDGGYAFVDSTGLCLYKEWSVQMAPREPEYQTVWVNLYANGCSAHEETYEGALEQTKCTGFSGLIGTFPITFKKP